MPIQPNGINYDNPKFVELINLNRRIKIKIVCLK